MEDTIPTFSVPRIALTVLVILLLLSLSVSVFLGYQNLKLQKQIFNKGGISFTYPQDWYVQTLTNTDLKIFLKNEPFTIPYKSEVYTPISISKVSELESEFTSDSTKIEELTIDGKRATQISGLNKGPINEGEYGVDTFIHINNKLLVVSLTDKTFQSVYDKIISSIKIED